MALNIKSVAKDVLKKFGAKPSSDVVKQALDLLLGKCEPMTKSNAFDGAIAMTKDHPEWGTFPIRFESGYWSTKERIVDLDDLLLVKREDFPKGISNSNIDLLVGNLGNCID